jgi:SAM-dependent methyltransferase
VSYRPEDIERNLGEKKTLTRRANRFDPAPPRFLPANWTRETLRAYLQSVVIGGVSRDEHLEYIDANFDRLLYTAGLVPSRCQKALEIGADPYFLTLLLKKFCNLELSLTNYFGSSGPPGVQEVAHTELDGKQPIEQLEFSNVNVETDVLPFPDDYFDLVFFCEVLEHLQSDPLRAILEINRVLKVGGTLILTTPNAVDIERIAKLLVGQNIYDQYSAYGPYGRHNREYSPHEIRDLLRHSGFQVDRIFTAGGRYFPERPPKFLTQLLRSLELFRRRQLGPFIFAVSRKVEGPSACYPPTLNALEKEIHLSEDVKEMSGFFDLEFDGVRYFRWSGKESILTVDRRPGQNYLFLLIGSPDVGKPRTLQITAGAKQRVSIKTGWHAYLVKIFGSTVDDGEIRLGTDPTFQVEGDQRQLGIMLASAIVMDKPPLKKPSWLYKSYSEVETDYCELGSY